MAGHELHLVEESDLPDLLPLMRGYCDFYEVDPADERAAGHVPRADRRPRAARDCSCWRASAEDGRAVGFATIFWSWSTLSASRIGVMNDLFVDRGRARRRAWPTR